jgi:hypothetical protein
MTSVRALRFIVTVVIQCSLFFGSALTVKDASAGTPDKAGNNADVYSLSVKPTTVPAGNYPTIKGFVRNTSITGNGAGGKAVFDVLAVIMLPNGSHKTLLWNNVRFAPGQRKSYALVNKYDVSQPGEYTVEYRVYNKGRSHRYASLSKTFTVVGPAERKEPEHVVSPEKKEPVARLAPRERRPKGLRGEERNHLGIGGYVNTLNFSGGPTFILWPLRDLAIQGSYGVGTFTSYEGRIFYRLPLEEGMKPYLGAGYLHTERKATVIGLNTTIPGDSFTVFAGVEVPLSKSIHGYIDVSGTPMKLKKDVVNGTQAATVKVEYSPVTINVGLVFYLF